MKTEKIGPQGRFPPGSPVPKTRARASPKCRIGFEDTPPKAAQGPFRTRNSNRFFNRPHGTPTGSPPVGWRFLFGRFLDSPEGAVVIALGKGIFEENPPWRPKAVPVPFVD